jgi:Butirosin biosynthesis protein H, N-terminal/Domain of unknown function (DUF4872)
MVPSFRHRPGHHCGSTAIRNLLAFHGVELSEQMAFGLGAGACFYFVPMDSPSRFVNGRTSRLEEQFVELSGAPLDLRTFDDPEASWEAARATVSGGAPALLLTDLYYLDHYGKSAHFPGHAVVLAGYDDEVAYLSDTGFEELQKTTITSLAEARHAQHPVFPLAGHMFVAENGIGDFDPRAAIPAAVARCAERMLEPPLGEYEGLPGLRKFAAEVGSWPELLPDWQWCARFTYQTIERRGTGGGNFRLMYSRFLEEAGRGEAALAGTASERWTGLASDLLAASDEDEPSAALWAEIDVKAGGVLDAEERLWASLMD